MLLLLYFSSMIALIFDTGTGNKRRPLNIKSISEHIGYQVCQALPGFHALTGCDTTSAFVRRGKIKPFKLLNQNQKYLSTFQSLGLNASYLTGDILQQLGEFVCLMYGKPSYNDTDRLRCDMFKCRY